MVILWSTASAQEAGSPEALRVASDLVTIISAETTSQTVRDITAQLWPKIERDLGSRVDKATLEELRTEVERSSADFAKEAVKDAPAVYARYFSAQEIRDIIAFYQTTSGAKALRLMPKIMAEQVASSLKSRTEAFQREVRISTDKVLRKHGYKK
jgi:hypothetical protein